MRESAHVYPRVFEGKLEVKLNGAISDVQFNLVFIPIWSYTLQYVQNFRACQHGRDFVARSSSIMDKKFIESMKKDLLARRETILASLAEQSDDMKKLVKTVAAGDVIDVASDAIDRTLLDSLGSQDAARLQLVDNALDRIRQGKYGKCIKCGKDIPQQRLKALPYALMCVNCASEEERKRR